MKPTIPEVSARFAAYRSTNPGWGSLHVVLEDENLSDVSVEFCIASAQEHQDGEGEALARILLDMSRTQRKRLAQAGLRSSDIARR